MWDSNKDGRKGGKAGVRSSAGAMAAASARRRVEIDIGQGGKYQGEVEDGVPHGEGRASFPKGLQFRGLWASGFFHLGELKDGDEVRNLRHPQ